MIRMDGLIQIRFHGRGGHGVKTASRILGTAAFLEGYTCQDSPLFGAERRGAAVVAYTRISSARILDRGAITEPDLIIVADETLLQDPQTGVLIGHDHASGIFINTADAEKLITSDDIHVPLFTDDLTGRTLKSLGRASALSAGLGAAAARLCGVVSEQHLIEALEEEFQHLGVNSDETAKNIEVAREIYATLPAISMRTTLPSPQSTARVLPIVYHPPLRGTPSVLHSGNSEQRHTGSWRLERPVIDTSVCTRCGLCLLVCPDGAVARGEHGYPAIDYDHCKGCMICRQVCPLEAVHGERETRAW